MKKLQSKLAANVRKVKEQSVVAPTPAASPKAVVATPAAAAKPTAATGVSPAPTLPSQMHPTRVWPD